MPPPCPRASLQGTVCINVDKIRTSHFLGFVSDEPKKVHVLRVLDVSVVFFASILGPCLNCPM